MTLTEGFVKDSIYIDFGTEVMYGSDQIYVEYPCRFATVTFELINTEVLTRIADWIRLEEGYAPMYPMGGWSEDAMRRKGNNTDGKILSLLSRNNEEAMQENANKNPVINSTMRDYMAGEVSRDLVRRFFMPEDVMKAHDEGIIHVHDTDYISGPIHNCDLIDLEDMLQNGTVISGTMIEKPHSFFTACNVTTQIVAQVASAQYGGQSFTLSHLAPFVDISRERIREETMADICGDCGCKLSKEELEYIVEKKLRREIRSGVQTIQYQIITLMTTNGQSPFVTIFMYLDEVPKGRLRDDLAMIMEEVLRQRIQGVKNEKGVWITPAFPKLIYVLDEDNMHEDSRYYHLTKLAAECTAKRLVPDYISAKVIRSMYPVGTRVELISMSDVQAPPAGTRGKVVTVDDIGTVHISWANGSSLGVVIGEDAIRKVDGKDD